MRKPSQSLFALHARIAAALCLGSALITPQAFADAVLDAAFTSDLITTQVQADINLGFESLDQGLQSGIATGVGQGMTPYNSTGSPLSTTRTSPNFASVSGSASGGNNFFGGNGTTTFDTFTFSAQADSQVRTEWTSPETQRIARTIVTGGFFQVVFTLDVAHDYALFGISDATETKNSSSPPSFLPTGGASADISIYEASYNPSTGTISIIGSPIDAWGNGSGTSFSDFNISPDGSFNRTGTLAAGTYVIQGAANSTHLASAFAAFSEANSQASFSGSFTLTAIPEPGSLTLLGLGGLGLLRRRRERRVR